MEEENLECAECGEHLGNEELLREHYHLEHKGKRPRSVKPSHPEYRKFFSKHFNSSTAVGFLLGIMLTSSAIAGGIYVQDYLEEEITVTVVTCENCTYERFKSRTDRMMVTDYKEVDYQSKKGEELIQRYNLTYVPGFIIEKDVEEHENFTQIRNSVIKYDSSYVIRDKRSKVAQRFSEGFKLN